MKLTGIYFGPGILSSYSFIWTNSECLVTFPFPLDLKHYLDTDLDPASDLKKYFGSLYSSPIALEINFPNVSVVVDFPRLLEKLLSLPTSSAGLLSFW